MEEELPIRWRWLKAMYIYTLVGAGGFGFAMLAFPGVIQSTFRFPAQDPAILKVYGSVLLASALIAIPALRSPLKFVPLLLFQLVYKPIWLVVAALPLFFKGQFPLYVVVVSGVFISYIIGDLIAIPFGYLFSKK